LGEFFSFLPQSLFLAAVSLGGSESSVLGQGSFTNSELLEASDYLFNRRYTPKKSMGFLGIP